MTRWRTLPADAKGVNRALQAAVRRGDRVLAKKLTKRAFELQGQLFGDPPAKRDSGTPFDDEIPF